MILTFDETEKIEILQIVQRICKKRMRERINNKLRKIRYPSEINTLYEGLILHIMNNSYVFLPRCDRTAAYRRILLHGIKHEIEEWEALGGQIVLYMTKFAYQFVRGRNEMIKILKQYGVQITSTELNSEVVISNYHSNYNQKKIAMEFSYLFKQVEN